MSDLDVVPTPGTVSQMADYLTNGYWAWANYQGTGPRHWALGQPITVNLSDLDAVEQEVARYALSQYSAVSGLSFAITSGPGQITFNNDGSHVASTTQTVSGQTLTSATVSISSDWHGYDTSYQEVRLYLREVGHAVGLGNLGQYTSEGTYGVNNVFTNDSQQLSVMSSFLQQTAGTGYSQYLVGPQSADIAALQSMYGAPSARNPGNTYVGGPPIDYPAHLPFSGYTYTIYDTGGYDTWDTDGPLVDLRPGHSSSVEGGINNVTIYSGTIIEQVFGGDGGTVFYGNSADNAIWGGLGTDTVVFDAPRSSYAFTEAHDPYSANDQYTVTGPGIGTDVLRHIEKFQFSDVTVQDDFPSRESYNTPHVGLGSPRTGSIDFTGDVDLFIADSVVGDVENGRSFTLRMDAVAGANPLAHPLLSLYSFFEYPEYKAHLTAQDSGSGVGANALIIFTPRVDHTTYLEAESVGASYGDYKLYIEQTAFHSQGSWTGAGRGDQGWYVGDFNGDGRDDLMRYVDGLAGAQVLASTGVAFADPVDFTGAGNNGRWWIGDFDGNGRDDMLRYNPGVSGAEVLLSAGTSFLLPSSWSGAGYGDQGWVVGDFNGDAADDLLRHTADGNTEVLLSTASGFADPVLWSSYVPGATGWMVGDFNGDGRDDLLRQSAGGPQVLLSSGSGFNDPVLWSGAGAGDDGWYVGDFNGDGKSDLMRYLAGTAGAQIFVSTGTEFILAGTWSGAGHGEFLWSLGNFDDQAGTDIMRYLPGLSGGEVFVV